MTRPVQLGLIGAGRWGRNYIPTVAALDSATLVSVTSSNPQIARQIPPECTVVADWREVAANTGVDGVIIATPPATHREMCDYALSHGTPVLVEKPTTLSLADTQALSDRARSRGVPLLVNHVHLFSSAYVELKMLGPQLGTVTRIASFAGNFGPYREDCPVLWDWGPHDVAMCIDLLGTGASTIACSRIAGQPVENGYAERLLIELAFDTGATAAIHLSTMDPKRRQFAVYGTRGTAVYDDLAPYKLCLFPPGTVVLDSTDPSTGTPVEIDATPPLARAVEAFVRAIDAGRFDPAPVDLAVEVARILERCATEIESA